MDLIERVIAWEALDSRGRDELIEVLAPDAGSVHAPVDAVAVADLWRWRDGVSLAVSARRGRTVNEDIVVPLDRLAEAIDETLAIGPGTGSTPAVWRYRNLHSTFLVDRGNKDELRQAETAAQELFELAARLGGSVSGEHGLGWVKRGQLTQQWAPRALAPHEQIKHAFDPKGLLNPGKKLARAESELTS